MSQELFITHCTTCRARLKVHDQDAIGQILSCPKCGSMVQVIPPADWKPPVAAAAAAVLPAASKPTATPKLTPTSSSLGVPAAPRGAATPAIPAPAANPPAANSTVARPTVARPSAVKPSIAKSGPQLPTRPQLPPVQASPAPKGSTVTTPVLKVSNSAAKNVATATTGAAAAIETPPPVVPPPIPEQAATSVVPNGASRISGILARVRQDWWMLAGGFGAGIVVGVSVWLVMSNRNPPADASADPVVAKSADTAKVDAPAAAQPAAEQPETEAADAAPEQAAEAPVAPAVDAAVEPPLKPFPAKQPAGDGQDPTEHAADKPAPADKNVAADDPGAQEADAPKPDDEMPADEGADLLGGQLALPQEVPPPDRSPVAIEKPAEAAVEAGKADDPPGAAAAETTQQEQASEKLASVLPPLDFERVPLNKFVAFITQYTSLSITIDRPALQKAGIESKSPVTVKRANTTVAQALRDALGPLGLTYRLEKETVVITVAKRSSR